MASAWAFVNTPGMGFSRQLSHTAFCCWSFFVLFLIPNFKKKLNSNNNRKKKKQSTLERKSPCVAQCRPALASSVSRVLVCRLPCPDPSGHYLMATATQRDSTHQISCPASHSHPLPPTFPHPHSLCLAACLKNQYPVCFGTALLRGRCSQPSSCSHSDPNILGLL